ncbi:uncharacterized protein LOC135372359 [Ornithodoros turicata]|uniref:uncharacterized protein LOC135372359 n=1 Tax=Ornithodoros turicata TaxID=34597 RepID=UPI003138AD3D
MEPDILLYPPEDLTCRLCGNVSTARSKFQDHYAESHNIEILWRCSKCLDKVLGPIKSISSHLSKCARRQPAASQPQDRTAQASGTTDRETVSAPEPGQSEASRATIISYGRWTDSELRALANLEVSLGTHPFINQELAKRFTTRSVMSIRTQRHQARYKEIYQQALRDPVVAALSSVPVVARGLDTERHAEIEVGAAAGRVHDERNDEGATDPITQNLSSHSEMTFVAPDWSQCDTAQRVPTDSGDVGAAASGGGGSGVRGRAVDPMELTRSLNTTLEEMEPELYITSSNATNLSELAELLAGEASSPPNQQWLMGNLGPSMARVSVHNELGAGESDDVTPHNLINAPCGINATSNGNGSSVGETASLRSPGSVALGVAPPLPPDPDGALPLQTQRRFSEVSCLFEEVGLSDASLARRIATSPISQLDLESILRHFGVALGPRSNKPSRANNQRRGHSQRGNRSERKKRKFNEHQRLYRLGPRVLLHQLMSEDQEGSTVLKLEEIQGLYEPIFSNSSGSTGIEIPSRDKAVVDTTPFSYEEVVDTLRQMDKKAAPGPDHMKVSDLYMIPPKILCLIMNNFFIHKVIPPELKRSRTIFIPKKVTPRSAAEVRPITMSPVICRLYSRLLLRRLSAENSFHPLQGCFQEDRETSTNLLALQALMKILKKQKKSLYAVSLDVRKAFDCVSHEAIVAAAEGRDIPEHFLQVLQDLYKGCSTSFFWNGKTNGREVTVNQGIKQGDPLSPFLFNAVLDPFLQLANDSGLGVQIDRQHAAAMAFADDLLLFSSSLERWCECLRTISAEQA